MDNTLRETLHLIFSAQRAMPAHFTSNGERKQSFCVNFELLTADQEYNMASEVWYSIADYLPTGAKVHESPYMFMLRCGEDIMIGAFIITQLGRNDLMETLKETVIADTIEAFPTTENIESILRSEEAKNYFSHCIEYAQKIAKG